MPFFSQMSQGLLGGTALVPPRLAGRRAAAALVGAGLLLPALPAQAASFTVTSSADSGAGSLRAAIASVNAAGAGPHTITLDAGLAGSTISLGSSLDAITANVTIDGSAAGGATISGGGAHRIFYVGDGTGAVDVTIRGVTLADGLAKGGNGGEGSLAGSGGGGAGLGGALFVENNASVTLDGVNFQENTARGGHGGNENTSAGDDAGAAGGGGISADGSTAVGSGGAGVPGGGPNGGSGGGAGGWSAPGIDGGDGGYASGGGGGGDSLGDVAGDGGDGGFGGGGGGGGGSVSGTPGGGGDGGFGGGAGGAGVRSGGYIGSGGNAGYGGGGAFRDLGGGGAGLGGAIFVRNGGTISFSGGSFADNNSAQGGAGGCTDSLHPTCAQSGSGEGGALFLMGGGSFTYEVAAGETSQLLSGVASGGALGLNKTGSGALVLGGSNVFSGGINVGGGVLRGTHQSMQGDINVSAAAQLVFGQDNDGNFSHIISGAGSVVKEGAGRVTLSGANIYTGSTRINAGALQVASAAAIGTGTLILDSGTFAMTEDMSLANNVQIAGSFGAMEVASGKRSTLNGIVSGAGELLKTGGGVLVLDGANTYAGATQIDGGTIEIGAESGLGAAGLLVLNGGRLSVTGTTSRNRNVAIAATQGEINVLAGEEYQILGTITGNRLVKSGGGTLSLDGTNAYSGIVLQGGVLSGNTSSLRGDVDAQAGTLFFQQAADGVFDGNILKGAGTGNAQKDGAGALTLNGTSDVDWTVYGGTLRAVAAHFGGDVDVKAGASFIFTDTAEAAFSGTLTGTGQIGKEGPGTVIILGDHSGFTGTVNISDGALHVGANHATQLGGSAVVGAGARLGGAGQVGTVTVQNGGILAPGNSIGTLTVNGDVTFNNGSVYEVEVDPAGTASDLVDAAGQAFLNGGSVLHIGEAGTYQPFSSYTILKAAGGVTGTFGGVASNFAFLTPELIYDPNTVYLELTRNDVGFSEVAITPNQNAVSQNAEALGRGNAVYDALVGMPGDGAAVRAAYDSLSGEVHAGMQAALIKGSQTAQRLIGQRLRQAGGQPSSDPVRRVAAVGDDWAAFSGEGGALPVFDVWGQGFGSWADVEGDGNAADMRRSSGGFIAGADMGFGSVYRAGVAASYANSSVTSGARAASAGADSYTLAAYGSASFGVVSLRGGALHSWHDVTSERTISAGALVERAEASYDARSIQLSAEAGYAVSLGETMLEPFAGLSWLALSTDEAQESGAAGLQLADEKDDYSFSALGLHAAHKTEISGRSVSLYGTLGWQHAFDNVTPQRSVAFSGGQYFAISGTPLDRDTAFADLGLKVPLADNAAFTAGYRGQIGARAEEHGVEGRIVLRF